MSFKKNNYDITYKVLVLGEASVGKTALIQSYTNNDQAFDPMLVPTIGIDYRTEYMEIDRLKVRVQIWDTAGQERFRTMNRMYFRGAKGILLVYDITNQSTFAKVTNWMQDLKEFELDKEEIIMVGNKIDLDHLREVATEEGKRVARKFGVHFMETSAKTRENVAEVFGQLVYNMKDANDPMTLPRDEEVGDEDWEQIHQNSTIITPKLEDANNTSRRKLCCTG